jgi:hypothetical protein
MPNIPLELIQSNPFRDFDLHPIDREQVAKLQASINSDGFWASVVAREVDGRYQIAFGHHRIEAARGLGMADVPIEVRDLSDWQMVRMLASENATQRGSTAAACLDAVAAISRVLAFNLLRWDEATLVRNITGVDFDYRTCRGMLEAGEGIGRSCVMAFAPKDAFTLTQVNEALAVLKQSGRMATIVAEGSAKARAELLAEQELAERALAEAQRKEAGAKGKAEKQAAAKTTRQAKTSATKSQKATVATSKAATAVKRQPIVYDARCAHLFKLDSHAETFRKVVTGETFQAYLKFDQQFGFAQSVLATLRENKPANKEITAADIRAECWSRIETGLGMAKGRLRTAPERPYLQEIKDGLNFIRRAAADYRRGVALVLSAQGKGEQMDAGQRAELAKRHALFAQGMEALKPVQEAGKLKLVRGEGQQ